MDYSIKFYTVKSGLSILYIEGSQVILYKNIFYLSLWRSIISSQTLQTLRVIKVLYDAFDLLNKITVKGRGL